MFRLLLDSLIYSHGSGSSGMWIWDLILIDWLTTAARSIHNHNMDISWLQQVYIGLIFWGLTTAAFTITTWTSVNFLRPIDCKQLSSCCCGAVDTVRDGFVCPRATWKSCTEKVVQNPKAHAPVCAPKHVTDREAIAIASIQNQRPWSLGTGKVNLKDFLEDMERQDRDSFLQHLNEFLRAVTWLEELPSKSSQCQCLKMKIFQLEVLSQSWSMFFFSLEKKIMQHEFEQSTCEGCVKDTFCSLQLQLQPTT